MGRVGRNVRVVADGEQYRLGDAAGGCKRAQLFGGIAFGGERGELFTSRMEEWREVCKVYIGIPKLPELFEKKNDVELDEVCGEGVNGALVIERDYFFAEPFEYKIVSVAREIGVVDEACKIPPRVRHPAGDWPPCDSSDIPDGD